MLAVIEAMKMETVVVAKADGVIAEVLVKERQPVKAGELIIKMKQGSCNNDQFKTARGDSLLRAVFVNV